MLLSDQNENSISIHFQPPEPQIHLIYKPIVGVKEACILAGVGEDTFRADHMKDSRVIENVMYMDGNRYKFETEPLLEYIHMRACELRLRNGIKF